MIGIIIQSIVEGLIIKYTLSLMNSLTSLYTKPYCRIQAYVIGLITGYYVHMYMRQNYILSKHWIFVGWSLVAWFLLGPLYGSYHVQFSNLLAATYNSLSRISWSIGLGLVIYLSIIDGGLVNKILSWSLWVPLSRLTFAAYLIHPMLIIVYYHSLQKPMTASHREIMLNVSGMLVWVYLTSILLYVFIECPLVRLEKLVRTCRNKNQ